MTLKNNEINLSSGTEKLIQAIRKHFPQLSNPEIQRLGNIMLDTISQRIGQGEQIAFWSIDSDGEPILTLLGLEIVERSNPNTKLLGPNEKR